MAKIVITKEHGVWRVSRRVLGPRGASAPGLVIARALVRFVAWPPLFVLCVMGVRLWRVEARTIDGRRVVWYVRGTLRARRVAGEVVTTLLDGRPLGDVLPAMRRSGDAA